jgi:hypothetical protein
VGNALQVASGAAWLGSPDLAADTSGAFVVVWQDRDGAGAGVQAQRFDRSAAPVGAAFRPYDTTAGDQTEPDASRDRASGSFVLAWTQSASLVEADAYARRYSADGTALEAAPFQINTTAAGAQRRPQAAWAAAGSGRPAGLVIAWDDYARDGSFSGVYAQAYDTFGAALDGEVRVAETSDGFQQHVALGQPDAGAPLVAVWQGGRRAESNTSPSAFDAFARRFNAAFATLTASAGDDRGIEPGTSTPLGGAPTAAGGTGPYSYAWTPAASLDDATAANPVASPPGTTLQTIDYVVLVTDGAGRTARDTVVVTVDPALPVELVAFAAAQREQSVVVAWRTASERNNDGFDVQMRPLDGDWQSAGWIKGAGTTNEAQDYAFVVPDLEAGAYRFRLRQVDLDGAETMGPETTLHVELTEPFALTGPYPSPARQAARMRLAVQRAQHVRVTLYDAQGRHVARLFDGPLDASQNRTLELNLDRASSGVYFVRVQGETFQQTRTLPVVR